MFTRNTVPADARPSSLRIAEAAQAATSQAPVASPPPLARATTATTPTAQRSIIGNDLKILGQQIAIICQGALQLDGEIQGDLHGREIVVGTEGKITGTIVAETVQVHGEVNGTVRGRDIRLMPTARLTGDLFHQNLTIDAGAQFEGLVRRLPEDASLAPPEEGAPYGSASGEVPVPLPSVRDGL